MAEQFPCIVCGLTPTTVNSIPSINYHEYQCQNCGSFIVDGPTCSSLPDRLVSPESREAAVLSHAIRKQQKENKEGHLPKLSHQFIEQILEDDYLPTPTEQAGILILWLGDNSNEAGKQFTIQYAYFKARLGASSARNVSFIIDSLEGDEFIACSKGKDSANVILKMKGWSEYYRLRRSRSDSKKAVMAMKFGNEVLTEILRTYLKPAVMQTGFVLKRLDEESPAGPIDNWIRVEIQTSRFLIADLTDDNAGAYWEAGFAEGLGKPVIYMCEKTKFEEEKTHFDTNHSHTIPWDAANPEQAADDLKATIRATLPADAIMEDE